LEVNLNDFLRFSTLIIASDFFNKNTNIFGLILIKLA
jgi:hypothetical protein